MRLLKPFFRLPVRLDAARLRAEASALPASAWAAHPNHIEGNSSVRLISAGGTENDDVNGIMLPTPHLDGKHTIYGEVVSGMETLKALEAAGSPEGQTKEPLKIEKVTISVE